MSDWDGLTRRPGGYRLGADPRPPRLVLLPGIEGDARFFLRQVPLAARRPVAALSLPAADTIPELAAALVSHLPKSPVVLFGASLGGLVGWQLALEHPQRIAGLITLGSLPDPGLAPRRLRPAGRVLAALPAGLFSALYRRRIAARLAEEGVPPALQSALLSLLPERDTLAARLRAVASWQPAGPPPVPTLWLRGQFDQEISWDTITVQRALPSVGVETVPGGHRAYLTHARALHAVIDHFDRSL